MAILQAQSERVVAGRFQNLRPLSRSAMVFACLCGVITGATGCQTFTGIPVSQVPRELLVAERKDDLIDINMLRLRQDPPEYYALGPGDVLGIHIPNILNAGRDESILPQVHYPEDSNLPPAVGTPAVVREDGRIALPFIDPVNVEGMSVVEATETIRDAYVGTDNPIGRADSRVIVSLIHSRTVRVLVIREESGGLDGVSKRGSGHIVDLPAYENDVLHALSETGGMPGTDAKNQIFIYRGMFGDGQNYDQVLGNLCMENCEDPCFCNGPLPDPPNMTKIPLRYPPQRPPTFTQEDILLGEGDILIIRSRDEENFYTAGLLGGGEFLLPRDRDLDIVGAIAIAGGSIGSIGTGLGGFGQNNQQSTGRSGYFQASAAFVMRDLPCGNQLTIKVDLNKAVEDKSERILIQPGDIILLRYTLSEEVGNLFLSVLQLNFNLSQLILGSGSGSGMGMGF